MVLLVDDCFMIVLSELHTGFTSKIIDHGHEAVGHLNCLLHLFNCLGPVKYVFFFYEELIFIVNGLAFFLFEFLISMFEWVLLRAWFIMFVGRKDLGVPPKYESQNLSVNGLRLLYAIVAIFWRKCRCRLVSIYLFGARWWWQHADDCWKRCKGIMPAAALVQLITVQLLEYNQGINPALAYPPRLPTFHWIQGTDCGSSITHHVFACMHEWYSGSTYNVVCHSSPSWMLHNYL